MNAPLLPLLSLLLAPQVAPVPVADEGANTPLETGTWLAPRTVAGFAGAPEAPTQSSTITVDVDPDGDMPREVAYTPDGARILVVHRDTDNVVVRDASTQGVLATIDVGDFPVDVAVSPDGLYGVVPNVLSDSVSILDMGTSTVLANVPVTGTQPYRVEITADSAFAVVGVINDAVSSAFSIIDLATQTEVRSIPSTSQGVIGFFFNPEAGISGNLYTQFAVSSDGQTVVLPDSAGGQVTLYDYNTGGTLATLATAASPRSVDVHPDGTVAVVGHESGSNTISEIDLVGRTVTGSFPTAALTAQVIRITPDKSHAIAAISNNAIFVNLATGALTATLSTGSVGDIELSFDGQYAFVSNFNSRVVDIASQSIVAVLPLAPSAETALSPVAHRAVALNNRFREDVHFYTSDGASSSVLGRTVSGPPLEGDSPRTLALSGDGRVAVVGNVLSRTVSVVDVATGTVRATLDSGDRTLGVAVSPDGTTAVACNGDDDTVTILDLTTDTVAAQLSILTRPAEVLISPDSQTAFVTTVAGTDRVHFIQLAGAASSVLGTLVSGQMGPTQAYAFTEVSETGTTSDGPVPGVCISFDDELLLIDTATRTELTRVPLPAGSFPLKVAFSDDGTRAYVLNAFGDSVSVVDVNGAGSSLITTVSGVDAPSTVDVDAAGAFVYVGNVGTTPAIRVLDTSSNAFVQILPVGGEDPRAASLVDDVLFVATIGTTGSSLYRVQASGFGSSVIDSTPLTSTPSALAVSRTLQTALAPFPAIDDLDVVRFQEPFTYCAGKTNALGCVPFITTVGFASATDTSNFTIRGEDFVPNEIGFLIYGLNGKANLNFHGGKLCVKTPFVRLLPPKNSGSTGTPPCAGVFKRNFNARIQSGADPLLTVGARVNAQYRQRDPGDPAGFGDSLSNGVQFVIAP